MTWCVCGGRQVEKALLDMSVLCTRTAQLAHCNSLETLDWTRL